MKINVLIRPECQAEIDYYVQESDIEVSGLGRVVKHDDGTLEVVKVYLLEQSNSAATTDIDPSAVADLLYQTREDEGDLNFWWHSHVNMGVFWSATDMATIKQFGDNGYLLATVFNKKREKKSAFYHGKTDFLPAIFQDDLVTNYGNRVSQETKDFWEDNFKKKAKKKVWTPAVNHKSRADDPNWIKSYYCQTSKKWFQGRWKTKAEKKAEKKANKDNSVTTFSSKTTKVTAEDEARSVLGKYSAIEYYEWVDACAAITEVSFNEVTDVMLVKFMDDYMHDYDAALVDVINIEANNDYSGFEDYENQGGFNV